MSGFDEIVDGTDLSPAERERLLRTHELLLRAGPPADLPPALDRPPAGAADAADAEIVQFPLLPKRRWAFATVAAAAAAAATFFGGYLLGHDRAQRNDFDSATSLELRGEGEAFAALRLGSADSVGNWPLILSVTGLPAQPDRGAYYELFLTRGGKPFAPCGGFRVHGKTTVVRFSVPYQRRPGDGWIVTVQPQGAHTPGRTVLST